MEPIFRKILYYHCIEPLDGALQMAIDELLLDGVTGVVFRDYHWSEPTTSLGYFGISSELQTKLDAGIPGRWVRRPTGGGLVEHGHGRDYTYSVLIGASEARRLQLVPRVSYRFIHEALADVLRRFGIPASLAGITGPGSGGQACFANPVDLDVMLGGKKIAGAGQKRCRGAILQQGSVQPVDLPGEFGEAFTSALAKEVESADLDAALVASARILADNKYRSDAWNLRR